MGRKNSLYPMHEAGARNNKRDRENIKKIVQLAIENLSDEEKLDIVKRLNKTIKGSKKLVLKGSK